MSEDRIDRGKKERVTGQADQGRCKRSLSLERVNVLLKYIAGDPRIDLTVAGPVDRPEVSNTQP